MKIDTYMCTNCYIPKIFKPNDSNPHICEKCGKEMEFWCTEELDSVSGKVINHENNKNDEKIDIKKIVTGKPTITCPTCQSTNVKPISGFNRGVSIAMLGVFSKKINKSFECKSCGYTW